MAEPISKLTCTLVIHDTDFVFVGQRILKMQSRVAHKWVYNITAMAEGCAEQLNPDTTIILKGAINQE